MEKISIVYANTIDYDSPLQQRPMHIMKKFAEDGKYHVYYINQTQRTDMVRTRINNNMEVYHNWDVFKKRVPEVDIYFSSWAYRHKDLDEIKSKIVIYDSLDNFPENENYEDEMIMKADILLTTSDPLYQIRNKQHGNVHMVRNACFSEWGNKKYNIPDDLKKFKNGKPIILFSGALTSIWCDLELVEKVAKFYQVVVVGLPWGIKEMPKGVHYLGSKKYDELQAYYAHCDITLLPFRRCQISDFSNPLKVYESLAHGKPVVATDIPEVLEYSDVVFSSRTHEGFLKNIEKAIKLKDNQMYISMAKKVASENTWDQRFKVIDDAITDYIKVNKIF